MLTAMTSKGWLTKTVIYQNESYTKILRDLCIAIAIIYLIFVSLNPFTPNIQGYNKYLIYLLFCGAYGVICFINIGFVFPAFNRLFKIRSWYMYSYIVAYMWLILSIVITHHLLQNYLNSSFIIQNELLFETLWNAFFLGLIPSVILGFWTYIQFLKKELNRKDVGLNDYLRSFPYQNKLDWLPSSGEASLAIHPDLIFYLKAEDNYVAIHYTDNGKMKKKLVRATLKSFSKNLKFPFQRVHRSFIVNFNKVSKIEGNTQGLTLSFLGTDVQISVSKSYVLKVTRLLKNQPA